MGGILTVCGGRGKGSLYILACSIRLTCHLLAGVSQVPVSCTDDVLAVMSRGLANRAVAETKMNERSSRSHSVLTVVVDGRSAVTGAACHGCLHLIDLAGAHALAERRLLEVRSWSSFCYAVQPRLI